MENVTKLSVFAALVATLQTLVVVTGHARAIVRELPASDYRSELEGALSLATELNDTTKVALFGSIYAMGGFPAGCWGQTVAELAFSYVSSHYTAQGQRPQMVWA